MENEKRFVSYQNADELWRRAAVQMGKLVRVNTRGGWASALTYVPPRGQIAVCLDREIVDGKKIPGIKIGDGKAYYADLPFLGDEERNRIARELSEHIGNKAAHVSAADRAKWDSKINCEIDGEVLHFTRE